MHLGDPRWDHPPPLFGNAIDLFGVARAQGFVVNSLPAPGEMVVYGGSYGGFGHIATVVAVEPGRYEVIEQNFLDFSPNLEPHWQTFDLRSVAWPDASVVGFVVGPARSDRARASFEFSKEARQAAALTVSPSGSPQVELVENVAQTERLQLEGGAIVEACEIPVSLSVVESQVTVRGFLGPVDADTVAGVNRDVDEVVGGRDALGGIRVEPDLDEAAVLRDQVDGTARIALGDGREKVEGGGANAKVPARLA
jgi:surface antigen